MLHIVTKLDVAYIIERFNFAAWLAQSVAGEEVSQNPGITSQHR
jgi:flavin-dependent dehydrogenase